MRILHFADLHIGVENYGRPDPATGLSTRLLDFLAVFDELVEYALTHEIDLVLFAGDAYKSRDPSQTQQREFAKRIARLTRAGIPVFLLVGNHDLPYAMGRATAVDIFTTLDVPLVTVGNRLGTYVVEVGRHTVGQRLQIVAVPWLNRSWLLAQEEYRGLSLRQAAGARSMNEVMEQKLGRLLEVEYARLDSALPTVLAGHLTHAEAVPGAERLMTVGADPVFLPSTLLRRRDADTVGDIEYGALGHIHKQQVLHAGAPLVYSGSLQRVDFGEEDQEKGFYVIDIDPERPVGQRLRSYEFVSVHARRFLTISVRSRSGNPTEDVLRAIERRSAEVADAIVRVRVNLEAAYQGQLDDMAVRQALAPAHHIAGVQREVEGLRRGRLGEVHLEGLTPQRALELYLQSRELSPERAQMLLEYGTRLVREAEEAVEMAPPLS